MPNHDAYEECPAIKELVSALRGIADFARTELGTIRKDGSRHTAGLAIDIMLDSRTPDEKRKAERLIAALIKLHPKMRWYDLIYTDFHIPGHPLYAGKHLERSPVKPETAAAHVNHVHVDWCDDTRRVQPLETVFVYDWPEAARSTEFADRLRNAYGSDTRERPLYQ